MLAWNTADGERIRDDFNARGRLSSNKVDYIYIGTDALDFSLGDRHQGLWTYYLSASVEPLDEPRVNTHHCFRLLVMYMAIFHRCFAYTIQPPVHDMLSEPGRREDEDSHSYIGSRKNRCEVLERVLDNFLLHTLSNSTTVHESRETESVAQF